MIYKNKIGLLAATAILLVGIVSSVAAQQTRNTTATIAAPEPISVLYQMKVDANELSVGQNEYALGQTYGWTSYGATFGDLPGYVFMSMNFTLPGFSVDVQPVKASTKASTASIAPPVPLIQTSLVTGGSWSQLIFLRSKNVGSVSGRIVGGELIWGPGEVNATIRLDLALDNGTGAFPGKKGKGTFSGTLDRAKESPAVSGTLTLEF